MQFSFMACSIRSTSVHSSFLKSCTHKDRVKQWFQEPDNCTEDDESLYGSTVLDKFWSEFKGGRSSMKKGETKTASHEKIRTLSFQLAPTMFTVCWSFSPAT